MNQNAETPTVIIPPDSYLTYSSIILKANDEKVLTYVKYLNFVGSTKGKMFKLPVKIQDWAINESFPSYNYRMPNWVIVK